MSPALDGTCTPAVGVVVCESGACEPTDNKCGLLDGSSCSTNEECRNNGCDPASMTCKSSDQGDIAASGSGLFCATSDPGSSSGEGAAGGIGLLLALVAVARRRGPRAAA
jgi:hypothetical protein